MADTTTFFNKYRLTDNTFTNKIAGSNVYALIDTNLYLGS